MFRNSANTVHLEGNLGQSIELKYTPSSRAVANASLGTDAGYKDSTGEWVKKTNWIRLVIWGDLAEACAKDLDKGNKVMVTGRMETRSWDDKDGKKQYVTEVIVDAIGRMIQPPKKDGIPTPSDPRAPAPAPTDTTAPDSAHAPTPVGEDDIPF